MATELKLSIVVPTFNERGNVKELISRVSASLPAGGWEMIFVDDDSPDKTHELVKDLSLSEYKGWVQDGFRRGACIALTSASGHGEFRPKPVVSMLVDELQAAGFVQDREFVMPGARSALTIWLRGGEGCGTQASTGRAI